MNKILLIFPKLEEHKDYHYVPFGILKVAARLLANKNEVKILDQRITNNFYEKLIDDIYIYDKIMISSFTGYQISQTYEIAKFIKKHNKNIQITLGGPHVTALPEQTIECKYIDYIWTGYAETGQYEIPWHLININNYINPETNRFIYISSYGCVGRCTFCATENTKKVHFILLETVEKDIDNLMKIHKFKEAVFFDATVFTIAERAFFIAKLMKKHNLKWVADARADEVCRMPDKTLDYIANSGLTRLTVGLETGSEKVANIMKKGKNHLDKYRIAAKKLSKYNIEMASGVIFATPGETLEDLKQTIEYIKEIKQINPKFRISTTFYKPLPNTEMAEMCKIYGYKEPKSLKEYAKQGSNSHYSYNQFDDVPWLENKEEYRKIYDKFVNENKELFV